MFLFEINRILLTLGMGRADACLLSKKQTAHFSLHVDSCLFQELSLQIAYSCFLSMNHSILCEVVLFP